MIHALIITGLGINCEEEMAAAYQLAGAKATIVHLNSILAGQYNLLEYDILNFPGGFSFGDDLGAGKALANKIKFTKSPKGKTLLEDIQTFLNQGKYILGICNGFQVLVELGLLPNANLKLHQEATLSANDSAKFEDRWVYCKVNPNNNSPFLKGIDIIELPARHGEGKLILKNNSIQNLIVQNNLNCMSYCTADGTPTASYPSNPNGAMLNCAALTNITGQVLGMMPHPEAFLSLYNHPNWGQLKANNPSISEKGQGLKIFTNIVEHLMTNKK